MMQPEHPLGFAGIFFSGDGYRRPLGPCFLCCQPETDYEEKSRERGVRQHFRHYEFESGEYFSRQEVGVIRDRLPFWREICSSSVVVGWIEHGVP
eukprot:scaffold52309_cov30-Prasinocladus_malaysianus.AAC.1